MPFLEYLIPLSQLTDTDNYVHVQIDFPALLQSVLNVSVATVILLWF